jgi:ABC-type nitrate/sulfonate/bicarbonate transport system permease component
VSDATAHDSSHASALSTVSGLTQWGLRGAPVPARRAFVLRVGAVLAFAALWSVAAGAVILLKLFNPIFLAGPWLVFGTLWHFARDGQLWSHVAATLERVVVGFSLGASLAVALGIPAGASGVLGRVIEPVVELLRPIPPLAVLPLFIVWVGIGETSKVAFITYATFFPTFLATVHAVRGVDPVLVRAAESLGARRRQVFARVVLPAALPEILTGIRVSVALAFFVIVIAEFVGAERGLGYLINDGRNFFLVPQMLGAAVVLGLLGSAASFLVALFERRWLRWDQPSTS